MMPLSLAVFLAAGPARAADLLVGVGAALSPAEPRLAAEARVRRPGGLQAGAELRVGQARAVYLDGWPVSAGTTTSALLGVGLPLVDARRAHLDLRIDGGLRWLAADALPASAPVGPQQTAWALEASPLATLPVGDHHAVQIGWTAVFQQQLQPRVATDATGQLVRVGVAGALGDAVQWHARAEAGGLFGYDGDGAKALVRATAGLRFVPGHASDWFNL
jgi:hypothetical protein